MNKTMLTAAFAGAMLFATAAIAGEYSNYCTMGLATGKKIQTDCSVSSQLEGKTYCFGSKEAMGEFMKDPKGNLAKADEFFKKG
jgi:YHS domain-containing protein